MTTPEDPVSMDRERVEYSPACKEIADRVVCEAGAFGLGGAALHAGALEGARLALSTPSPASTRAEREESFQDRVAPWMQACFGPEISADRAERGDRLLEEVFELLQSGGYDPCRAMALANYVWNRPAGEPAQEVGGVMVTLAAYCLAHDLDMHDAAEVELARIWTKVETIRAKQAAKPTGSALPIALSADRVSPPTAGSAEAAVTIDSADYRHTFYGILNRDGGFWTPIAFSSSEAAEAHWRDFWRADPETRDSGARTHAIVPVRVRLEVIAAAPSPEGEKR